MRIVSIEPTPSPNNMKLNMDEALPEGVRRTYTQDNKNSAPLYIRRLLDVDGIKSVFQVADFISVERYPKADWQVVLSDVRRVFEQYEDISNTADEKTTDYHADDHFGEVNVFVQMFKDIPIQVKLTTKTEEKRFALPERFAKAAMEAQPAATNLVLERKWEEHGVRYGEPEEIGEQVVEEIAAAYDDKRLERLVSRALNPEKHVVVREEISLEEIERRWIIRTGECAMRHWNELNRVKKVYLFW